MQSKYFAKLLYNKNCNKKPQEIDANDSYPHIENVFYEPDVTEN